MEFLMRLMSEDDRATPLSDQIVRGIVKILRNSNEIWHNFCKSDTPSKAGGLMSVTAPRAGELH
jgi:hypothetical protein